MCAFCLHVNITNKKNNNNKKQKCVKFEKTKKRLNYTILGYGRIKGKVVEKGGLEPRNTG